MSDLPESLSQVLQHDPVELARTLEAILARQQEAPADFDWLGLAKFTTTLATSTERFKSAMAPLQWARVALLAYEYLIQNYEPSPGDTYKNSSLLLRANMIGMFGNVPGDPVQDLQELLLSFFENLPLSSTEVEQKLTNRDLLTPRERLTLRNIKRNVEVIKHLCDQHIIQPDQAIQPWLSLYEKLP